MNVDSAVDAVRDDAEIDLVLMDIDLGRGMDGAGAAEIILHNRDIPVVFLSSHTEPEIVDRTEKISSYGYVVKNSGDTVLLASIRMAFRLREAYEDLRKREEKVEETLKMHQQAEVRIQQQNSELEAANEELQSTIEELQAANEEFEAVNEELARSQREILKSEEKFSSIFRFSPSAITVSDLATGMIVEANEGVRWTGWAPEEIIGKTSAEIGSWIRHEDRDDIAREVFASGRVINRPVQFIKRDGSIAHAIMNASIIEIEGKKHLLAITYDATLKTRRFNGKGPE
jgi:PAS domain S-box-containing protein